MMDKCEKHVWDEYGLCFECNAKKPRQVTYADRQKAQGNRIVKVWVPADQVDKLKEYARILREGVQGR